MVGPIISASTSSEARLCSAPGARCVGASIYYIDFRLCSFSRLAGNCSTGSGPFCADPALNVRKLVVVRV